MYEDREYKISEFAAMTGMTPSKIRFYEKQGLFPVRKHENGYRYFTANDAFRMNAFLLLLVYGFSVDDAIAMLDAKQGTPEFEQSLLAQREKLERQARELRYRMRRIDSALDLLHSTDESKNLRPTARFAIVDVEDQLYVRASQGDDFAVSQRNEHELAAFYELLGVTSCARIISRGELLSQADEVNPTYIMCMPQSEGFHLEEFDGVDPARVHRLVMGKCLRFRRQLTRSQSVRRETFDDMFAWLDEHGYQLRADILLLPGFLNLDGQGSDIETLLAPIK